MEMDRLTLARRLRELREDLYGGDGVFMIAKHLGVPMQTWLNYESGVVMPADILLQLIELTDAEPHWLLTGKGSRLRARKVSGDEP
jgi:hypothetical protein